MKEDKWLYTISSKHKLIDLNFKEIWRYKDLLFLFVKRDIVTVYKQTVLGPLWYIIQPLFTSIIFTLIFNNLANIPTGENIPPFLFNLAGITIWNYFKLCLTGTSNTFVKNKNIFGKVYFPRVIMPMSVVLSNLLKLIIQCFVLTGFYVFYIVFKDANVLPSVTLLFFPLLVFIMAFFGLGLGMIISSLTTKYKDLTFLIQFGVQLLMYGSAVMYPISFFRERVPEYAYLIEYNPIAVVVEAFRGMVFNGDVFNGYMLLYSGIYSVTVFIVGLMIFNRTEKSFIDTV